MNLVTSLGPDRLQRPQPGAAGAARLRPGLHPRRHRAASASGLLDRLLGGQSADRQRAGGHATSPSPARPIDDVLSLPRLAAGAHHRQRRRSAEHRASGSPTASARSGGSCGMPPNRWWGPDEDGSVSCLCCASACWPPAASLARPGLGPVRGRSPSSTTSTTSWSTTASRSPTCASGRSPGSSSPTTSATPGSAHARQGRPRASRPTPSPCSARPSLLGREVHRAPPPAGGRRVRRGRAAGGRRRRRRPGGHLHASRPPSSRSSPRRPCSCSAR